MLTTSFNGEYLIHNAVINSDLNMIKLLLSKHPELLEQLDSRGQTPLLCAAPIIDFLIAQGANVNAIIDCRIDPLQGKTVLHCARQKKTNLGLEALVQAGALDTSLVIKKNDYQSNARLRTVSNVPETIFL